MALITKPNYSQIWASGGDKVEPTDLKKQQGWTVEAPPFQFENWIQNRQDQMLAHINQRGIPAWDATTEYEAGGLSYVQGSDGVIYQSVAASGPSTTTQDPVTDVSDTYWKTAFLGADQVVTKDSNVGAANLPAGSTAQRPAAGEGKLRFNTDTSRFEGNNGTAWGSLGGATGGGNDDVFYENSNTVTTSYTITAGKNAVSAGPITVQDGATISIPDGSAWTIV